MQFLNLIPFGCSMPCLEMKQHFYLRTRSQLTVGSQVPRWQMCLVRQPLRGCSLPRDSWGYNVMRYRAPGKGEMGGELEHLLPSVLQTWGILPPLAWVSGDSLLNCPPSSRLSSSRPLSERGKAQAAEQAGHAPRLWSPQGDHRDDCCVLARDDDGTAQAAGWGQMSCWKSYQGSRVNRK